MPRTGRYTYIVCRAGRHASSLVALHECLYGIDPSVNNLAKWIGLLGNAEFGILLPFFCASTDQFNQYRPLLIITDGFACEYTGNLELQIYLLSFHSTIVSSGKTNFASNDGLPSDDVSRAAY